LGQAARVGAAARADPIVFSIPFRRPLQLGLAERRHRRAQEKVWGGGSLRGPPGPAWTGAAWFLCAQLLGGFLLAIVFVLNHTGMEVYDASKAGGFYDRQARATRNTPSSIIFDWITGGLNSQIEHHMFPTMARRNLPKMRALTKAAVLECGYAYEELKNRDALRAVLVSLSDAARA